MKIEIKDPKSLFVELISINGFLMGAKIGVPELSNVNSLITELLNMLEIKNEN